MLNRERSESMMYEPSNIIDLLGNSMDVKLDDDDYYSEDNERKLSILRNENSLSPH